MTTYGYDLTPTATTNCNILFAQSKETNGSRYLQLHFLKKWPKLLADATCIK